MVKSMFAGVAGMRAHQQKMDVIGNNIANVNTWGYKAASANFKESLYQTIIGSSAGNGGVAGGYSGQNSSQVGYGSQLSSITSLFTKGNYAPTDNALDTMISGSGFFIVGPFQESLPEDNWDTVQFTRVGKFSVDGEGYLVDDNRNYVYGYAANDDGTFDTTKLIPLTTKDIENSAGEQVSIETLTMDSNGNLTGVDGKSDEKITIGRLALVGIQNPNGLEKESGPYYNYSENAGTVNDYEPGGAVGTLINSALELSNVDLSREFSEMIITQRGFQANSKIITVTDEMLQELVNLKR